MFNNIPYQHLTEVFGLANLTSDGPVAVAGTDQFTSIQSLWVASMYDYEFYTPGLIVSVVHTREWSKGVFLIPDRQHPDRWILSPHQPMTSLSLADSDDSVEEAMRSIDAFPQRTREKQPRKSLSFKLYFRNEYCVGEFGAYEQMGFYYSPKLFALQHTIVKTMISFVDRYDNDEMRLFTKWYRGFIL
jgi:hypothetical protein